MCISGTRRPLQSSSIFGDISLLTKALAKPQHQQQAEPSFTGLDFSAFEPTPFMEPTPLAEPSTTLTAAPKPRKAQHEQNIERSHAHIVIQHNYHDHANDSRSDYQEQHPARGGVVTPFPLKLHEMLDAVAASNQEDIVSWQPHGRCFVVHKPKEFVELLPKYFKLSKLPSFQRQLNLYGFQRLTRGKDKGGYYHELFLRNRVFLAHNIQRIKVKGTGVRARSNPEQEPNLWSMAWLEENNVSASSTSSTSSDSTLPVSSPSASLEFPVQLQQEQPIMPAAPWSVNEDELEQNLLCGFDNNTFHYLSKTTAHQQGIDALLASEADTFFDDFDFPETLGDEIESDDVFGDLLEQMIA
jgi:hypothetical protein